MDKIDKLYQLYKSKGIITDATPIEKFRTATEEQKAKLYELGKSKNLFQTTDINTFTSAWGAPVTDKKKEESALFSREGGTLSATPETEPQKPSASFVKGKVKRPSSFNKNIEDSDFKKHQELYRSAKKAIESGDRQAFLQSKKGLDDLRNSYGSVMSNDANLSEDYNLLNTLSEETFKKEKQKEIRLIQEEEKVPFKETKKKQLEKSIEGYESDVKYTPEERVTMLEIQRDLLESVDYDSIDGEVSQEYSAYSIKPMRTKIGMLSVPQVEGPANDAIKMAVDELIAAGKEPNKEEVLQRASEIRKEEVKNKREYEAIDDKYKFSSIIGKSEDQEQKAQALESIKKKRESHAEMFKSKVSQLEVFEGQVKQYEELAKEQGGLSDIQKTEALDVLNKYKRLASDITKNYSNIENDTENIGDFDAELDAFKRNHTYLTSASVKSLTALEKIAGGIAGGAGMINNIMYDLTGNAEFYLKANDLLGIGKGINESAQGMLDGVSKSKQLEDVKDAGDAIEWAGALMVENTPQILINVLTNGQAIPFLSASAAGEKYMEIYGDDEYSNLQKYAASILVGAGTAVSEKLELAAFNKLWPSKRLAKAAIEKTGREAFEKSLSEGVKKGISDVFSRSKKALAGVNQEGVSEVADQLSRNLVDKYVLDKEDVSITDGLGEAYLSGAVVGAGLGAAPHVFSSIVRPFVNDPNKDILKNVDKIQKLNESLATADDKMKPIIQERIDQLRGRNEEIIQKAVNSFDSLSPSEVKEAIKIYEDITSLKKEYSEIKEDTTIPPDVKEALLESVFTKYNSLVERRLQILKKAEDYAVQEQTTSEVPVQPEAAVGEEVAQGTPEAGPEVVTEEGKEEVANVDTVVVTDEKVVPAGKRLFNEPNTETAQISKTYKEKEGIETSEGSKIEQVDTERSMTIADAYEAMQDTPGDPEVQEAYNAMADETAKQHQAILDAGYEVEIWEGEGEPYANAQDMIDDVKNNKHMYIYSTEQGFGDAPITEEQRKQNKLLKDSGFKDKNGKTLLYNDLFRFVHDFFGHTERGNGFGAIGEENAWDVHSRMYSPKARRAMTTETRGQNSWVNFGPQMRNKDGKIIKKGEPGYLSARERQFAPQKMGLLPEEFSKISDERAAETTTKTETGQQQTLAAEQGTPTTIEGTGLRENIKKSIAKVFKSFEVKSFKNGKEMAAYARAKFNEETGDRDSARVFAGSDGKVEVLVNEELADDTALGHEVWHALLLKAFGDNQAKFAEFRDAIDKTLRQNGYEDIAENLKEFASRYGKDEVPAEEYLAQLGGMMTSAKIDLKNLDKAQRTLLQQIKDIINDFAIQLTGQPVFLKEATPETILDFMSTMSDMMAKGEDVSQFFGDGTPGSTMTGGVVSRAQIGKDSVDSQFDMSIEYDDSNMPDDLQMPDPETIEKVLEKSGGAAIFINSDGTKVGITRDGKKLQGGWRYAYFKENIDDNIGFAATSEAHVGTFYDLMQKVAKERDEANPEMAGKPVAIFVTIQNSESMLGEWYAGEFLMDGLDKAITEKKTTVAKARKLMDVAISDTQKRYIESEKKADLKKKKKSSKYKLRTTEEIKKDVAYKQLVSLKKIIDEKGFDTHEGRLQAARELGSKEFSFGFRSSFLKTLIPLKSATGNNKEIKKLLLEVGYGRKDFYKDTMDEVLYDALEKANFDESSIGGSTFGGFYADPSVSKEKFIANKNKGIQHDMFNESFSSNGETFRLDKPRNVNKLFPSMGFPDSEGYDVYNKANNAKASKASGIMERNNVSKWLLENGYEKNVTNPFTAISGTMYTSTIDSDYQVEEPKVVTRAQKAQPQTIPGYDRMIGEVQKIVEKSKKRGVSAAQIAENVINYIQNSRVYERADDLQREQIIRDARKDLGLRQKSAPRVDRILGIKDSVSTEDKKNLMEVIKAQVKATKNLVKAQKEIAKQINKEIRELKEKGKITTSQMIAALRRLSEVDLLNEESVSNFLDYIARVFKDAAYYERVTNINRKRRAARNSATTKIGIADGLTPLLQKIFSIDARTIPEKALDAYEELVNMFADRSRVLQLSDIENVTKMAQKVFEAVEGDVERARSLAEVLSNYENMATDENGNIEFSKTVDQMVNDGSISAEDGELMKKYKSMILEEAGLKKEKDVRSEEEIEEERQQLVETVQNYTPVFFQLPTQDERNVAREIFRLIKTGAIDKMSNKDLKDLLRIIDNIERGFLPHSAQIMKERMNQINNGETLSEAVNNAQMLPVESRYAKIKALFGGSAIRKAIDRNPLFFIDELFGNFKSTPIFDSIFKPISRAFSSYQSEVNTINRKIQNAMDELSNSLGKNPNKVQFAKQKIMAYMLESEYQANPNSKEVRSAKDFLDATIKYAEETEQNSYSDKDIENLKKISDEFFSGETVDLGAMLESFSPAEKKAIKTISDINNELSTKVAFTSAIIRGRKVGALNNYIHHNTLGERSAADIATEVSMADVFNASMKPSTKAKSLIERTGTATPLVFDPFSSTTRGARQLLMDYHLTEPIRTARRTVKYAESKVTGKQKRILNAISGALEQALSNTLINTYHETTFVEDAIRYMEQTGYRAMLGSIPRAVAELTSNLSYVMLYDPASFKSGISKYRSVAMSEAGLSVMKNVKSQQTERLYPASKLSGRGLDKEVMSQASGIKAGKSQNDVMNAMTVAYNYSGKQVKNFAEATADALIGSPDKAIMKPLWFGAFAAEFKKATGQDVDYDKIANNNEAYLTEFSEAIDQAAQHADETSVRVGASDNPFTGILKGANAANQSAMKQAFNKFNNFMSRFLIYEYTTARTGVYALMGSGKLTQKQGAAILGATMSRMIVYSLLSKELVSIMMGMLGFGDDEEDEKTFLQKVGQATGSALSGLILGRNFGNFTKAPINIGVEKVNKKFLDFLREGEYDPYEDAIQYTIIPKEERKQGDIMEYVKSFSGAFSPMIGTMQRTLEVAARDPKTQAAQERRLRELSTRTPLEILGNTGYIPLYRDVRKIVMESLYEDMRNEKKGSGSGGIKTSIDTKIK